MRGFQSVQKLLSRRKKNINLPRGTGCNPFTIGHLEGAFIGHPRALLRP
jgi:hypothetical protein